MTQYVNNGQSFAGTQPAKTTFNALHIIALGKAQHTGLRSQELLGPAHFGQKYGENHHFYVQKMPR
ncbi:Unannotated [Lentimonas sp. CC4]|nr:Unannotated [Lentimonas sp. CC4]CAA6686348.1 Unannotated [Lentimonas sp. CC6]CAA7076123.1 Unannotated [Lentimonas sp. CC4]CAA7170884.1 Unannotated [Lentimonas sp. CC21]CAA7181174.1 Unannotated [Lentimonas sp. CC8]